MKKIIGIAAILLFSAAAFAQNSKGYSNHSATQVGVYGGGEHGTASTMHADKAAAHTYAHREHHYTTHYTTHRGVKTQWHSRTYKHTHHQSSSNGTSNVHNRPYKDR